MKITLIPTDKLVPAERNPNKMTSKQFDDLVQFIETFGFLQPVVVSKRTGGTFEIVDGHHRVRALKQLCWDKVPCVVKDTDSLVVEQLRLGMNAHRGDVDLGIAAVIYKEQIDAGVPMEELTITGMSAEEINDLIAAMSPPDEMAVLEDMAAMNEEKEEREEKPKIYGLELVFADSTQLRKVKTALRRASHDKKDLSAGLLSILGVD